MVVELSDLSIKIPSFWVVLHRSRTSATRFTGECRTPVNPRRRPTPGSIMSVRRRRGLIRGIDDSRPHRSRNSRRRHPMEAAAGAWPELKNAIDICRASEAAGRQLNKVMTSPEELQPLQTTTTRGRRRSVSRRRKQNRDRSIGGPCRYCGRQHALGPEETLRSFRSEVPQVFKNEPLREDVPICRQLDDEASLSGSNRGTCLLIFGHYLNC